MLFAVVFAIMLSCIPLYRRVQTKLDGVTGAAQENLSGARHPRLYPRTDRNGKLREKTGDLFSAQQFVGRLSALLNPLTYVIINLAIVAILRVGGVRVNEGAITQGQLIALYNYMSQILVELIKFANLILNITKSGLRGPHFAGAGHEVQHGERRGRTAGRRGRAELEFRHVSFRYPQAGADALTDISFCAAPGETIGVIGGTGSGKSTLANLIPRFYDATDGQVLVRGEDVKTLQLQALRTRIGVVPQKALLFLRHHPGNLHWGNADASDEALWDALRAAQADGVVQDKKASWTPAVEPGGRNFSGGQRQRLTIARALVRRPELLILDDSASALDFATDAALRKALSKLPWKPTVVLISQRVSSIRHADKIVVLDDGHMAGLGTHQLQQTCPVYQEICRSQEKGGGECIMKHTSSWALRRVLKSLGRYLPLLLASLLLAAASVAGTLYIPILVGDAIDQIVGPRTGRFCRRQVRWRSESPCLPV